MAWVPHEGAEEGYGSPLVLHLNFPETIPRWVGSSAVTYPQGPGNPAWLDELAH